MRSFIESISTNTWEVAGSLVGLAACGFIALQLYHEWLTDTPSSLSWFHLIGFIFVYLFWFLYGLRFRHIGVWLPNAVAVVLQCLLFIYVATKNLL